MKFVSKSVQATLTKHRQMALNHRNLFFTVLEAGSPGSGDLQMQCLVRALFLVIDAHFLPERQESSLGSLL